MAEPKTNRLCDYCHTGYCIRRARFCSQVCKADAFRQPLQARFESYIDKTGGPTSCWPWTGRVVRNYGQLNVNRRGIRTHRLAWQLANGPIPDGLWVLHHCDMPLCCNPAHLFLGTVLENNRDAATKRRHMHGARHYAAKLTPAQVHEIRLASGTYGDIGKRFGVSGSHVGNVKHRRIWKHLD